MTRCSAARGLGVAALLLSTVAVNAAEWAGDLAPDRHAGLDSQTRRAPAGARRFRRHAGRDRAVRGDDSPGGGPAAGLPQEHPERSAGLRRIRRARCRARPLPAFPPGRNRSCQEDRRIPRRQGQTRGQSAPAAGCRPVFLLAARQPAGNAPSRLLVGESHARYPAPARRKNGVVLARSLRHQRRKSTRLPQDAQAGRAVPGQRHRQLPRTADRRGAGPGHASLPRRRR